MKALFKVFNKYTLALTAFVVWMLFFDQNDWNSQRRARAHLKELDETITFLTREIEVMDNERMAMMENPDALEKFAREKYRMKRDGEDLYVVEP